MHDDDRDDQAEPETPPPLPEPYMRGSVTDQTPPDEDDTDETD